MINWVIITWRYYYEKDIMVSTNFVARLCVRLFFV